MSGNLYKWYGYLDGGIGGGDTNANGNDLTNVNLLTANEIIVENISVGDCITGTGGTLVVCDNLDVTNNTNTGSLTVEGNSTLQLLEVQQSAQFNDQVDLQGAITNTTGNINIQDNVDITGGLDIQGAITNTAGSVVVDDTLTVNNSLIMPTSEPQDTINLLNVTVINGIPTSTSLDGVLTGSLVYNQANDAFYVFDGTNWAMVLDTNNYPDLQAVTEAGNTTTVAVDFQNTVTATELRTNQIRPESGNTVNLQNNLSATGDVSANAFTSPDATIKVRKPIENFTPGDPVTIQDSLVVTGTLDVQGNIFDTTGCVQFADCVRMPQGVTAGTTSLFTVTRVNGAGPPTSGPGDNILEGSLAWGGDDRFYLFNGATWERVGTVTSVGLTTPPEFTVTGSPITDSGTLTVAKANQNANLVYASPDGGVGQPVFRQLTANDIPGGVGSQNLSQVLAVGNTTSGQDIQISSADNILTADSRLVLTTDANVTLTSAQVLNNNTIEWKNATQTRIITLPNLVGNLPDGVYKTLVFNNPSDQNVSLQAFDGGGVTYNVKNPGTDFAFLNPPFTNGITLPPKTSLTFRISVSGTRNDYIGVSFGGGLEAVVNIGNISSRIYPRDSITRTPFLTDNIPGPSGISFDFLNLYCGIARTRLVDETDAFDIASNYVFNPLIYLDANKDFVYINQGPGRITLDATATGITFYNIDGTTATSYIVEVGQTSIFKFIATNVDPGTEAVEIRVISENIPVISPVIQSTALNYRLENYVATAGTKVLHFDGTTGTFTNVGTTLAGLPATSLNVNNATGKFTPGPEGVYRVSIDATYSSATLNNDVAVSIRRSGSIIAEQECAIKTVGFTHHVGANAVINLTAGTDIDFLVFPQSATATFQDIEITIVPV